MPGHTRDISKVTRVKERGAVGALEEEHDRPGAVVGVDQGHRDAVDDRPLQDSRTKK